MGEGGHRRLLISTPGVWWCALDWWTEISGLQRGGLALEQGKEEDTLGQIVTGRHDAFRGTKELAQMGNL